MIKEHIPYYEHLAFEDWNIMKKHEITYQEWTWKPRGTCWKDYIRLQRNMRRLIVASLLSLTVNVVLLGVIIL